MQENWLSVSFPDESRAVKTLRKRFAAEDDLLILSRFCSSCLDPRETQSGLR